MGFSAPEKILWGRGSSYNFGEIPDREVRVERSRNPDGWSFLISSKRLTYLFVDNERYATKEELDTAILDWIHRHTKLTI